ncbi:hypothetical protein DFH07DRAFT_1005624 [Mycena maculata]|uniref:DUF6534 domain-containing protein n=1 Tax=Mycena maculata TaxID=230809 RepID=A0AAD7HLE4_9AGAR|nr:hypothetical protein DFH07DRAFT_1005624 [Mycena maculata]
MSALPAAPDVILLFGPLLLGVILNSVLYGILLVQAFMYYNRYKGDRVWFRYLVLYLVIMETANWVCDIGLIFEPLIVRFATMEALVTSPVMLRTDAVITVLISTPIQLFIAWRVRTVTRSFILPSIIALFAIVSFGGGVAVTTIVTIHPDFADFGSFHPEVITWLVSTAACDVFLTGSLVYSLWVRKTSIVSTDSYLNKIIRLAVQTGSITAAGALLDLILYVTLPGTTLNFMFDFPLSKLYTNALISTLNARPWRESSSQHEAPNVLFEQTPVIQTSNSFSLSTRRSSHAPPQHVSFLDESESTKYTLDIGQAP